MPSDAGARGPLTGLRVVDFGQYIAGPLTAVLLADQGADVVHVDPPGGPRRGGVVDAFYNRGKRRVILDLKDRDGLAEAARLVAASDVVVENFRPGVLARLGLEYETARRENPGLIWCALPGFASDDPRAGLRGFEGVIAAATANCHPRLGEQPPDWDWSRPTYTALPLASHIAGYLAATGVVMALIARRRRGRGQRVDVPLFDAMFTLIGHSGAYPERRGLHSPRGIHQRGAGAFRCSDGRFVQFDTSSPRHLSWFARATGVLGEWDCDLLDLTANSRPEVNERLHARLRELFATRPSTEWEEIGNRAGAAIAAVRTPQEWIGTEHARRTGAVAELDDPEYGPMWCAGRPVRLSAFPEASIQARGLPGADTSQVREEVAELAPRAPLPGPEPDLERPLAGMKILDLGVALAGPTCGRMLAEFGAEVLKIDPPGGGIGGYLNRGKDSLLLDLDNLAGRDVFWRLVDTADVVLENFSPGTAEHLAIGYDEVHARRPETVYTSISCYGRGGPWTRWRGWERQGQAVTGIMERTELPSVLGPYNIVDIGTGILGTFATGLALYHRQSSGVGQLASASLAQTATYHQAAFMFAFPGHRTSEPRGYRALGAGPLRRFYRGARRWFFLGAVQHQLAAVARVSGRELSGLADRALEEALAEAFASCDAEDLVGRLVAEGVAAHLVTPLEELMTDELVRARGLSVRQQVDGVGTCTMPGVSARLSDTPARVGSPPRRPGSDASAVLTAVGLGDRLEQLARGWVVREADLPPAWP